MTDHVVIAIPTFRRPKSLARLLDAIAALDTAAHISVLVADNDAVGQAGLALCRSLGLRCLAEGVETAEQAAFLQAEGCPQAQGYYYARPMNGQSFQLLLESGRSLP